MSLSEEFTVYCLSEKKGWINTLTKYDNKKIEESANRPEDTLMEIQFVTSVPYPTKILKYEGILFEIDDKDKLKQIQEKFGEKPDSPYIKNK